MKNHLSALAVLASATLTIMAQTHSEYPGMMFCGLSPDGSHAASFYYNFFGVVNTETETVLAPPEEVNMGVGVGSLVSDNGIVVGVNETFQQAFYWQNGDWKAINTNSKTLSSYAQGISADGKIIIGSVSPASYAGDYEGIVLVPCYWELQADGTYSEPVILPHPDKDLTGRAPQYITAIRISEDGNTIAGQMVDFTGYICQPIIFKKDNSGDWSYEILLKDVFYPEDSKLPPFPGIDSPLPQDFMTPEELQAYEDALASWNGNDATYPVILDFLDPKELVEYQSALEQYNKEYDAFMDAYYELLTSLPLFEFNNVLMSANGKYYASTDIKYYIDYNSFTQFYVCTPYIIDIETGTFTSYPDSEVNIVLSSITNDGILLGQSSDNSVYTAWILPEGENMFIPLVDYISAKSPELGNWMKENLTREVEMYDEETYMPYMEKVVATGVPFTTSDLSVISLSMINFWDFDYNAPDYAPCYSYILKLGTSGVESLIDEDCNKEDILRVYNLNGINVLNTTDASALKTLPKGIYIINGKKIII